MAGEGVELGFTEELDNPLLFAPSHFPSKVGGHPAWLDPALIPTVPTCGVCSTPLLFLSQIYAGLDRSSNGFHRSIYVFCCRNGDCYHSNSAVKVFRCQLGADNPYYSVEPLPEEGGGLGDNKSFAKSYNGHCYICQVCGGKAPNKCSKCKRASYCTKQHQKTDWERHKAECGEDEGKEPYYLSKSSLLYKELDLVIEREVLPDKENRDDNIEEINGMEDKYKMTEEDAESLSQAYGKDEDPTFTKFKLRISHEPSQVLRYKRHGAPIWPVSTNQLTEPEACTNCSQPRSFEFMLLPTLLYVLGVGKETGEADWACIAVYTCSADCEVTGYTEELGWVQSYAPVKS